MNKLFDAFIKKAKAKYGDKFTYHEDTYVNSKVKTKITCPVHGDFWVTPDSFLQLEHGCPECAKKVVADKKRLWTKETCCEEAKKYKTKVEFSKKSPGAYNVANREKWIHDYDWFEGGHKTSGYWTYERTMEEAKKYKYKKDFRAKSSSAYVIAKNKGWIKDMDFFEIPPKKTIDPTQPLWEVYTYFLPDNSVYVGLTRVGSHDRKIGHGNTSKNDILLQRCTLLGIKIPDPVLEKEKLCAVDAQYYERYYSLYYKSLGYEVLNNIDATGVGVSSLGGDVIVWDKTSCYEEAKKYSNVTEFMILATGAYHAATRYGWLSQYYWFEQLYTKEVYKYSIEGKFIEKYLKTKDAAKSIGVSPTTITGYLKSKEPYKGYYWRYKVDIIQSDGIIPDQIDITDRTPSKSGHTNLQDDIVKYSLDGDYQGIFASYKDAIGSVVGRTKGRQSGDVQIARSCYLKTDRSALGFIWRWKKDVLESDGTIKQKIKVK